MKGLVAELIGRSKIYAYLGCILRTSEFLFQTECCEGQFLRIAGVCSIESFAENWSEAQ